MNRLFLILIVCAGISQGQIIGCRMSESSRCVFHTGASYKFKYLTCPPVVEEGVSVLLLPPARTSCLSEWGPGPPPASNSRSVHVFPLSPPSFSSAGPEGQQSGGDRR